jgi:hypothetical protein
MMNFGEFLAWTHPRVGRVVHASFVESESPVLRTLLELILQTSSFLSSIMSL